MSFLGNSRPDLLKNANSEPEATPRGSEARFIGDVPPAPEAVPSFGADRYAAAPSTAGNPGTAGSNDVPLSPERCTNVIAAGARWKGSLQLEDSARIDGVFSGDIEAKGTVHVSEGAEVDAKIHAAYVVVSGSFRGEIHADKKAELMPTSRVAGEVVAKALSIHEGATLDGTVQMTGDSTRPAAPSRTTNRNGTTPDAGDSPERRGRQQEPVAAPNGNGA